VDGSGEEERQATGEQEQGEERGLEESRLGANYSFAATNP
jgi:hypothetical protein